MTSTLPPLWWTTARAALSPSRIWSASPATSRPPQRLVGQYLSKLDAEMTVDGNTIKLGTFLIDENGLGLLTYSVENPSGVGYTDVGYGEGIDLPLQPTLHFRSPDEDNALFAKCYVDKGTSTDTA